MVGDVFLRLGGVWKRYQIYGEGVEFKIYLYFHRRVLPSEIHSMASVRRLVRVAVVLASSIQVMYSFLLE